MTIAVRGRTLPANFGAYRANVEGVEGYVLSISGHAAFFDNAACDLISQELAFDRASETEPVDIVGEVPLPPAPSPRPRWHR